MIHYRSVKEKTVECINQRQVDTRYGEFELRTYRDKGRGDLHFVFLKGDVVPEDPFLVRVHVMDIARDLLSIKRPDEDQRPSWSYQDALKRIATEGSGVLVMICHDESTEDVEESIDWLLSGKQPAPSQIGRASCRERVARR